MCVHARGEVMRTCMRNIYGAFFKMSTVRLPSAYDDDDEDVNDVVAHFCAYKRLICMQESVEDNGRAQAFVRARLRSRSA